MAVGREKMFLAMDLIKLKFCISSKYPGLLLS